MAEVSEEWSDAHRRTKHRQRTNARNKGEWSDRRRKEGGGGEGGTDVNKYLSRFVLDNDVGRNDVLRFCEIARATRLWGGNREGRGESWWLGGGGGEMG